MAKKDKILDILSLSQLSEEAKLARIAHRWVGKPVGRAQAKAIVKVYFDANGRTDDLTDLFMSEKHHQEKLRNGRRAFAQAEEARQRSPMLKYTGPSGEANKNRRVMEIAQRTFGPAVKENFNEDTLALMSLISGEDRWYQVLWRDAGFKPKRSALVEVVTVSKGNATPNKHRFLLYKTGRRVLVARTKARSLKEAWGDQLPPQFMESVPRLKAEGCSFQMDYEAQQMLIFDPSGDLDWSVDWTGRTVD